MTMIKGLLLIDKPEGKTSFQVVSTIKKLTHQKRVGHTGTLDPMATGVLPVFLGRATTLSSYLLDADKSYTATFRFGITTDTADITGKTLTETEVKLTEAEVIAALNGFLGEISQAPPMYSAIKRNGVPLYKLARNGETVDIEPRRVTIKKIEAISPFQNNEITVNVTCSKGTYIRSLCRDVGEKLGCGATLSYLRRTATTGFSINDCVPLEALNEENISSFIINEEKAVDYLRSIAVTEKQAKRFVNGGRLDIARLKFCPQNDGEAVRIKYGERLLGLGTVNLDNNEIEIKCLTDLLTE